MSNPSIELGNQLQTLVDKDQIRDLPARYCDCVWRDDVAGILSLFSADGRFVIQTEETRLAFTGTSELEPFYRDGLNDGPRPYIHNHVIELIDSENATGRCYLDLRSAKHGFEWLGAGYYEDTYVKTDGSWLFAERIFHALRIEEWPGGIVQT